MEKVISIEWSSYFLLITVTTEVIVQGRRESETEEGLKTKLFYLTMLSVGKIVQRVW
jgi:hypothetical protein